MNLIETYNGSGLYAQYATSADYASNGQALSAALTAVPDTYLQNTDLATADGKVTAISGIPLSAGGDVPEGVMSESGLEYNAVNEISGYNGSAIAQYGAEKQWLVHDDTLVHASNSAQYALGVNLSAISQLLGIDETVLWSGSVNANNSQIVLDDDFSNYRKLSFIINEGTTTLPHFESTLNISGYAAFPVYFYPSYQRTNSNGDMRCNMFRFEFSNTKSGVLTNSVLRVNGSTIETNNASVIKIIGIGRKQ